MLRAEPTVIETNIQMSGIERKRQLRLQSLQEYSIIEDKFLNVQVSVQYIGFILINTIINLILNLNVISLYSQLNFYQFKDRSLSPSRGEQKIAHRSPLFGQPGRKASRLPRHLAIPQGKHQAKVVQPILQSGSVKVHQAINSAVLHLSHPTTFSRQVFYLNYLVTFNRNNALWCKCD